MEGPRGPLDPSLPFLRSPQALRVDAVEEGQAALHGDGAQTHPHIAGPWDPASGPPDTRSGRSRQCCGSAHWDRPRGRPRTRSHLGSGSKER